MPIPFLPPHSVTNPTSYSPKRDANNVNTTSQVFSSPIGPSKGRRSDPIYLLKYEVEVYG